MTAQTASDNLWPMPRLKQFFTPVGALAMIVGLWLPWADVRCGQVQTEPTFWQLANYDHRMYLLLIPVAAMLICGIWTLIQYRKSVAITAAANAFAAVCAWFYLWIKKDDVAALQAQLAMGGGDLARMARELQVYLGMGFKLYLAGALVALASAFMRTERPMPSGRPLDQPGAGP